MTPNKNKRFSDEFKGAGHWPMWENPDEYVAVLRTFLESESVGAAQRKAVPAE
jgi:pimeloyl-ACP methyl ester carboxylesterase